MSTDGERLAGKRAVVTGAASGIGRATALRLAADGASVLALDLDERALEELASERIEVRAVDVRDRGGIDAAMDGAHILVANAGIVGPIAPFWEIEDDAWREVLDVNLLGVVGSVRAAAPRMVEAGGGAIVCTSSVAGLRSGAGPSPYSASKAAILSFVQTAAWQLSGTGVRINAVCPGLVETGMTRPMLEAARAAGKGERIGQLNPSRRAALPEELAGSIAFLVGPDASYVNGQALVVDGGLSASHPVLPGRLM